MGKLKLKFLAIALTAIILTIFTQNTLAYYSTVGKATNVVTSGEIKFVIHETTDQGKPFPLEGVYIKPGDVVSKEVCIENVCSHPFYLRVKIIYGIDATELTADECFKLNIDESNWKYVDGWYYYLGVVDPYEKTPEVFTKVEIVGNKVDNSYIGKTLTLTVAAQAVQSEHNAVDHPWDASGWPEG